MSPRWIAAALAPLAVAACQKMETPEQANTRMQNETAAERPAIEQVGQAHFRFINENKPDSFALTYAEQGVMMPPNAPAVTGRAAIAAAMGEMIRSVPGGVRLTRQTLNVSVNGPLAVERGSYVFSMSNPRRGQPDITTNGKYLIHWHKVADQWLIAEGTWSDDVPPPATPGGSN